MILGVSISGLEKSGFSGRFRVKVLLDCLQEEREENEVGVSNIPYSFREFYCKGKQKGSWKVI